MTGFWWWITEFGDSAVTLSLALFVVIYLTFFLRRPRAGLVLAVTTGGTALVLLLLKLAFRVCINPEGGGIITSPSGHVAMSAAVYGSLAILLGWGSVWRLPILVGTGLFVAAIAVSRLVVLAHNPAEVATGLVIGTAFAVAFGLAWGNDSLVRQHRRPLLLLAALTIIGTYGLNPPIEEAIKATAAELQSHIPGCD
ncbi:phosphatase PAP2 family protein [Telmatospirillum sp.]|uniref:phosphatase PAP2 family protein n=1 Tax=Telmatospirillum sp. TaxID=2079197 RepID=UPI00284BCD52|nr:phosphatase PAP2 family protein [Telmatospirillum sp.]MDR3439117.1 hypothetical protein [Telmatospirillum sp.]